MNTKQILTGIQEASCRAELSAHVDLIDQAIERDGCSYDSSDWLKIEQAVRLAMDEFNERVFH